MHRQRKRSDHGFRFEQRNAGPGPDLVLQPAQRIGLLPDRQVEGRDAPNLGSRVRLGNPFQANTAEADAQLAHLPVFGSVHCHRHEPAVQLLDECVELLARQVRVELEPLDPCRDDAAPSPPTELAQRLAPEHDLVVEQRERR